MTVSCICSKPLSPSCQASISLANPENSENTQKLGQIINLDWIVGLYAFRALMCKASLQALKLRNSKTTTQRLTWAKCRATCVAKNQPYLSSELYSEFRNSSPPLAIMFSSLFGTGSWQITEITVVNKSSGKSCRQKQKWPILTLFTNPIYIVIEVPMGGQQNSTSTENVQCFTCLLFLCFRAQCIDILLCTGGCLTNEVNQSIDKSSCFPTDKRRVREEW